MIYGGELSLRIVVENGDGNVPRNLCIPSNATIRPSAGEYVMTKDGLRRFIVVKGEWCKLFEDRETFGFLLTLREVKENPNQAKQRDSLLQSTQKLYRDIDRCITNLVDAKRYKDGRVQDVLYHMESLMAAALQQFGCVIDYLEDEGKEWKE